MKYLLIVLVIAYGLTYWCYKAADRPGDDFGAVFPLLALILVDVVGTVIYIGWAFWEHRFW